MFNATKWKNTVLSIVFFLGLIAIGKVGFDFYKSRVPILDIKIENAINAKKIIKVEIEKTQDEIDSIKKSGENLEKEIFKKFKEIINLKELTIKKLKQDEKDIINITLDTSRTYDYLSKYRYNPIFR